uniref:Uncharacterized protein n=1 Tax=Oryza brachyantha TaxID=4533 RepID=J3LVN7_ORYBR
MAMGVVSSLNNCTAAPAMAAGRRRGRHGFCRWPVASSRQEQLPTNAPCSRLLQDQET